MNDRTTTPSSSSAKIERRERNGGWHFRGARWQLLTPFDSRLQSDSGNADSGGGSGDAFSTCTITMNKCSLFKSNKLDRGPGKSLAVRPLARIQPLHLSALNPARICLL